LIFIDGFKRERIERNHHGGSTYRNRMASNGRSASPHWRTRLSKEWRWRRLTKLREIERCWAGSFCSRYRRDREIGWSRLHRKSVLPEGWARRSIAKTGRKMVRFWPCRCGWQTDGGALIEKSFHNVAIRRDGRIMGPFSRSNRKFRVKPKAYRDSSTRREAIFPSGETRSLCSRETITIAGTVERYRC
jgi:hypothetical protein